MHFMGHLQTVQYQISRHRRRRLIGFCTVFLQNELQDLNEIVNYYPTTLNFKMDSSNW